VHHADLGGGEADAQRVVHHLPHPPNLLGQRGVEALDRQRAAAQDRVAVLAHQPQRLLAARAGLGIEPLLHLLRLFGGARRRDGILVCHRRGSLGECERPAIAGRRPR
jgi:hypothetical protein